MSNHELCKAAKALLEAEQEAFDISRRPPAETLAEQLANQADRGIAEADWAAAAIRLMALEEEPMQTMPNATDGKTADSAAWAAYVMAVALKRSEWAVLDSARVTLGVNFSLADASASHQARHLTRAEFLDSVCECLLAFRETSAAHPGWLDSEEAFEAARKAGG